MLLHRQREDSYVPINNKKTSHSSQLLLGWHHRRTRGKVKRENHKVQSLSFPSNFTWLFLTAQKSNQQPLEERYWNASLLWDKKTRWRRKLKRPKAKHKGFSVNSRQQKSDTWLYITWRLLEDFHEVLRYPSLLIFNSERAIGSLWEYQLNKRACQLQTSSAKLQRARRFVVKNGIFH